MLSCWGLCFHLCICHDIISCHTLGVPTDLDQCNTTGDIRLVGGENATEGRVEVCYDNLYRVVCDDFWDELDAMVACRQLGYTYDGKNHWLD